MTPPRAAASRSVLETAFQVSVVAALLLLFCWVASTVVITFVVAVIYAYVLEPFVTHLERWRVPRLLAILAVLLSSLAALGLLAYFLWEQVASFQRDFPKYRHEVEELVAAVRGFLESLQDKTRAIVAPAPPAGAEGAEVVAVQEQPSPMLTWGGRLLGAVNAVVAVTLIPFLTFFMLSQKTFFKEGTVRLLCRQGFSRDDCETLIEDMNRQIRAFAIGKVFLHAVLAVLTTAALLLIGVDYAWIWGPLSAVIALIPIFGFVLGMLPPVLIALIQFDSLGPVLWVVAAFVVIQFLETYVLTPKVVGMTIRLNPLATLLAVLVFGWLWGAIGTVLALPITAVLKAVCDHVEGLRELGLLLGNPDSEEAAG